ncbi:galactokinase [Halorhabdus rudnickae]|uniref:galactokinase n=1 Tax=Halorhabdus rudnickae TaxID=1775544 RepID=UPI00108470F1|nr:galactokinase [Halorhabdus rudnickae]
MRDQHEYQIVSPGRVNLIGEHTDYTYGYVMPLATDLHTRLDATPTDQAEEVQIRSEAIGETRTVSIDDPQANGDWTDYVAGCYAVLQAEGYDPAGFVGELSGDLPLGSGMSSSASLELAIIGFLDSVHEFGLSREEMATLAQRVENDFVGVSCGIMDQFAVALGQADHALKIDTESLGYEPVRFPEDLEVVVFHTGVERELVDSEYNQRRETVEAALDTLGESSSKDVSADDLDALPPLQKQRLGYVIRENERVQRAVEALESGDNAGFGDVLVTAHRDIAENYEASCAELDFFVDAALEEGAYGARLTGAGWGGTAIAIVDTAGADAFAESVYETYTDQFPDRDPHYHLVTASEGVSVSAEN